MTVQNDELYEEIIEQYLELQTYWKLKGKGKEYGYLSDTESTGSSTIGSEQRSSLRGLDTTEEVNLRANGKADDSSKRRPAKDGRTEV